MDSRHISLNNIQMDLRHNTFTTTKIQFPVLWFYFFKVQIKIMGPIF